MRNGVRRDKNKFSFSLMVLKLSLPLWTTWKMPASFHSMLVLYSQYCIMKIAAQGPVSLFHKVGPSQRVSVSVSSFFGWVGRQSRDNIGNHLHGTLLVWELLLSHMLSSLTAVYKLPLCLFYLFALNCQTVPLVFHDHLASTICIFSLYTFSLISSNLFACRGKYW